MQECLDEWCLVSMHVNSPAKNARHVPITMEDNVDPDPGEHSCRCDRWGHPCPGRLERKPETHDVFRFSSAQK
jgi:hypothetical protein